MTKKQKELLLTAGKILFDAVLIALGLYLAWVTWFNGPSPRNPVAGTRRVLVFSPVILGVYLVCLCLGRIYRISWKYADVRDMLRLAVTCVLSTAACLLINRVFGMDFPRTVIAVHGIFTFLFLFSSRYLTLLIQNLMFASKTEKHVRRSLIVGAGREGVRLLRELPKIEDGARHEGVAFLDDDLEKLYRKVAGVPVEGTTSDIIKVIGRKHIDEVLFSTDKLSSEAASFIYLNAAAAHCAVSRYSARELKPMTLTDVLDGQNSQMDEITLSADSGVAILGSGELAEALTRLCCESGAGNVFALSDNCAELKRLSQAGAWAKLGDPVNDKCVSEFLTMTKPAYVFYMAGLDEKELIPGNEETILKMNAVSPVNALRLSCALGVKAFVMISGEKDPADTESLFACGESALFGVENGETNVITVSMDGLLTGGGYVSELMRRASMGKTISVRQGTRRAFLSCRNAARALLGMVQTGCEGRFTLRGVNDVSMEELAGAVKALTGSHSEIEVTAESGEEEGTCLTATEIPCVYRREQEYMNVPACVMETPSRCPDAAACAAILKG